MGELTPRPERVSAVVDRELGILLRRELSYPDETVRVTEFVGLEVGGAVDPSVFSPVAGSFFGARPGAEDGSGRSPLEDLGVEALKLVGGLAAGGLGAAIKYSPKRQADPFAAATTEDPDDAMPDDEPLPAWAGGSAAEAGGSTAGGSVPGAAGAEGRTPVGDEVLALLYRGGLEPTAFSGRLCEWMDGAVMGAAIAGAVPESARRAGFGGVGFLVDTVLSLEDSPQRVEHSVYSVRVGGWERFRIDRVFRTRPARERKMKLRKGDRDVLTVTCDGQRTFRVYEDEVRVGPASGLEEGWLGNLAQLVDGSWLLGCRLWGGEEVEVDGRAAYRVIAATGDGPVTGGVSLSWVPMLVAARRRRDRRGDRSAAAADPVLDGGAALRHELRSVSDGGSDDFGFTPPNGLPVVEESERSWSGRSHADDNDDADASDDDLKFFGPDGRRADPPDEVRAVVDAVKKQVEGRGGSRVPGVVSRGVLA